MKRSEIEYRQLHSRIALTFVHPSQRLVLRLRGVRAPSLQCYAHGLRKFNTTIKVIT